MRGFKSIFVSAKHKINCFLIQEKYFQTANAVDTLPLMPYLAHFRCYEDGGITFQHYIVQRRYRMNEWFNPRPVRAFLIMRTVRGGGVVRPPGDRPLMVVELCGKKNSRCVSTTSSSSSGLELASIWGAS